ncbi:MAG: hypothetical protein LBR70_04825 [Lactobacillaceae bacterium]|jgi:hypothetical protein|nr:hypothetical protein [Lactobacillaceae bacterium]
MVEDYLWNSFEVSYIVTQTFVAIGTMLLCIFSAIVSYKAYRENNVENWLKLEFAYFTDNPKTGLPSLCLNLRDNGRIPLKISNAVMFFLDTSKIMESASFATKEIQEVNLMDIRAVSMDPTRIKSATDTKTTFNFADFYEEKVRHLDVEKIKRVRIGILSNVKYHKFELSEEEVYYMTKYMKEYKNAAKKRMAEEKTVEA